eukprot:CAMPEP_0198229052 /NCGR_PEP_ID=MMETSP1445-20131203/113915_1 /TAXON_ID=36898 /ORGANISM="Pyramimonas sp., Strain CCMP2087" /LENGTH=651 /DNA_ID=CAMNT_0043909491 /DNA_START=143 /DNA_END=2098 /DNA_ORIENTATION=+
MNRLFQAIWVGTAIFMPSAHALTQCQADEISARIVQEIPGMLQGGGGDGGGGGGGPRPGGGGRKLHMAEHEGNHEGMETRGGAIGGCLRGHRTVGGGRKLQQTTTRGDAIGGLVRLSFHDSGTYDVDGSGGRPDGCLLLDDADNGGIAEIKAIVEDIYLEYQSVISRADFWALSANVAMGEAFPNGVTRDIPYRWGRVDASSCEFDAEKLPDSEGNLAHVLGWAAQLGMSDEEIVALMGAHTLGRAVAANSGYEGEWVPQDAVLDNVYFRDLVEHPWGRTSNDFTSLGIGRTTTQWNDNGRMMLTTDMVLAFDLGDTPNVGNPGRCGGNNDPCTASSTRSYVDVFRQSNDAWYDAFFPAWQKLQELGYEEGTLKALDACSIGTSSPTTTSPTTASPTTSPTTPSPTVTGATVQPTASPTTASPTTSSPTTTSPTASPTTPPFVSSFTAGTLISSSVSFFTQLSDLNIDQFNVADFARDFNAEFAFRVRAHARQTMRRNANWTEGWDTTTDVTVAVGSIVAGSVRVSSEVAFPSSYVADAIASDFAAEVTTAPAEIFSGSVEFAKYGDITTDAVNNTVAIATKAPTTAPTTASPTTTSPTRSPTTVAPTTNSTAAPTTSLTSPGQPSGGVVSAPGLNWVGVFVAAVTMLAWI